MAEDGFDYTLGMKDDVSGPARQEIASLKALQAEIGETEKAVHKLHEAGEKEGFGRFFKELFEADLAAKGVEKLGESIVEAGKFAVESGIEIAKFAIESVEFRRNTELAYAAVQGTAEEGRETFEQIDKMAEAVHMPAQQAHGLARDLMLQGLEDTKLIGATIAAQSALIRTGQEQGAAKLKSIIEKSLASGHFDAGKGLAGGKGGAASGRSLAGLGIHLPDLLADLSKRTGLGLDQVKKQLKAGKIDTQTGIAAIVDAINTGVVGKTAAAKYDIRDLTTDIKNDFEKMAEGADFGNLDQQLKGIADDFERLDGKDFFQSIVSGVTDAIEAVDMFWIKSHTMFINLEIGAVKAAHYVRDIFGGKQKITAEDVGEGIITTGRRAILDQLPGGQLLNGLIDAHNEANKAPPEAPKSRADVHDEFSSDPDNTAQAIRAGEQIGQAGIKGIRAGSRTHSPSEDTKDIGHDWADGLVLGFAAGPTPTYAGGAAGGGRTVHVDVGGIHVHGSSGDDMGELTETGIADVFERIALELGQ